MSIKQQQGNYYKWVIESLSWLQTEWNGTVPVIGDRQQGNFCVPDKFEILRQKV